MTEQEIVSECLTEIFRKNGYPEIHSLTQRDFEHISVEIQQKTGILISGSTIKRLLCGQFSRLPQIATLDAISRYLGFKNWQEYRSAARPAEALKNFEIAAENRTVITTKKGLPKKQTLKFAVIGCIVLAVIALAFIQFGKRPGNFDKGSFSVRKTTAKDIPNTVIFQYNVDDVDADSFFIQQSWDEKRRVRVFKNNYTLTDIYYEPGYHIAKLIANDSVIRAIDVSIPTDRWFLSAKDTPRSTPEYIKRAPGKHDANFEITARDLLDNHITTSREKEFTHLFFPSKLAASSENFSFKTRVKMREIRNNFCPYISLEIFTQRYPFFLKITPKGCASESALQLGEQFLSGKSTDLGFLGADVTQWVELEILVKNKQVKIVLNEKEVYSATFKNNSQHLTGIGFMSNGLCEVDGVTLQGLDGTVVYDDSPRF